MLDIKKDPSGTIFLAGRFDASQADKAKTVLLALTEGATLDFANLEYISSAGLGVLLAVQKNLHPRGQGLRLINVHSHIKDVFHFSGFDQIFEIA
jgi:anti-sigma B factor antagonist